MSNPHVINREGKCYHCDRVAEFTVIDSTEQAEELYELCEMCLGQLLIELLTKHRGLDINEVRNTTLRKFSCFKVTKGKPPSSAMAEGVET